METKKDDDSISYEELESTFFESSGFSKEKDLEFLKSVRYEEFLKSFPLTKNAKYNLKYMFTDYISFLSQAPVMEKVFIDVNKAIIYKCIFEAFIENQVVAGYDGYLNMTQALGLLALLTSLTKHVKGIKFICVKSFSPSDRIEEVYLTGLDSIEEIRTNYDKPIECSLGFEDTLNPITIRKYWTSIANPLTLKCPSRHHFTIKVKPDIPFEVEFKAITYIADYIEEGPSDAQLKEWESPRL